jgi:hypothetical protein
MNHCWHGKWSVPMVLSGKYSGRQVLWWNRPRNLFQLVFVNSVTGKLSCQILDVKSAVVPFFFFLFLSAGEWKGSNTWSVSEVPRATGSQLAESRDKRRWLPWFCIKSTATCILSGQWSNFTGPEGYGYWDTEVNHRTRRYSIRTQGCHGCKTYAVGSRRQRKNAVLSDCFLILS